jgi:hypothetical protein
MNENENEFHTPHASPLPPKPQPMNSPNTMGLLRGMDRLPDIPFEKTLAWVEKGEGEIRAAKKAEVFKKARGVASIDELLEGRFEGGPHLNELKTVRKRIMIGGQRRNQDERSSSRPEIPDDIARSLVGRHRVYAGTELPDFDPSISGRHLPNFEDDQMNFERMVTQQRRPSKDMTHAYWNPRPVSNRTNAELQRIRQSNAQQDWLQRRPLQDNIEQHDSHSHRGRQAGPVRGGFLDVIRRFD